MSLTYEMTRWPNTVTMYRDEEYFGIVQTPQKIWATTDAGLVAVSFGSPHADEVITIWERHGEDIPDLIRRLAQLERRPF